MEKLPIEQVRSLRILGRAWAAIRRNAKSSKSEETRDAVAAFEADSIENVTRIQRQLQGGWFKFAPATGKRILKKNKKDFRPLVIAPLPSRIVQRAIHDVLVSMPKLQMYIKTPHSFGGIQKGQEKDEITAVPAAIRSALDAIGKGSQYIVRSDISDFFTKIPKSTITSMISEVVCDEAFMKLFSEAIKVELENMASLKKHAAAFPIEDIGVAQGNSLSPLLGNLYLYDFDKKLNESTDIRCIRYIDDFIILAPNKSAAENQFQKALAILRKLGLSVSESKTQRSTAKKGFEFLGIELCNGLIRPNKDSRDRLINSVSSVLTESRIWLESYAATGIYDEKLALFNTFRRIRGITQGWGKHYWFCNDRNCFAVLDKQISRLIRSYLASYSEARRKGGDSIGWDLIGIGSLSRSDSTRYFVWPT